MSNRPSKTPSPSNSPKSTTSGAFSAVPEVSDQPTISSESFQDFAETPQATAGLRSQSSPDLLSTVDSQPVIVITGSPSFRASSEVPRQSQPLVSRFRSENNSSSLPPPRRHSLTPYSRLRSRSQPRRTQAITAVAMSSASSSPGSTSTAPATSGSSGNPSYQLPYAPFPYPMPANARGSGQGQQSGNQGK